MAGTSRNIRVSEIDRELLCDYDSFESSSSDNDSFVVDNILLDGVLNSDDDIDDPTNIVQLPTVDAPAPTPRYVQQPWSQVIRYSEPNPFLGNFDLCHNLPSNADEIDFFNLLLGGDEFYDSLVTFTNQYAAHKQQLLEQIDKNWEPVSKEEIKAFLGINIFMGIYDFPSIEEYFNSHLISCPIVNQAMTVNRFKKITQYLHISDIELEPKRGSINYDPLYKIRIMLNILESFSKFMKPDRDLAIDEAMVGFKGRIFLKQYMPKKPTKWGIKMWSIACSNTGYVLGGQVYLGKKERRNKDLLLGEQVVMNLGQPFFGKFHHLYFDNFFNSLKLCSLLLDNDTYACGTARNDRIGWPKEFKNSKKNLKLSRGEHRHLQNQNVIATVWHDRRDVSFLSTNSNPNVITQVEKKTGNGRETVLVDCPEVVINYTKNMGGVDKSDQYRSYYAFGRSSKKWWKYLFNYVINVLIVNSFILRKLSNLPAGSKHGYTQLEFRKKLITQLIGNFTSRKVVGRKRNITMGIVSPRSAHKIVKTELRRVCQLCVSDNKKTEKGHSIKTPWKCRNCDIYLCKNGCFLSYHQNKGVDICQ